MQRSSRNRTRNRGHMPLSTANKPTRPTPVRLEKNLRELSVTRRRSPRGILHPPTAAAAGPAVVLCPPVRAFLSRMFRRRMTSSPDRPFATLTYAELDARIAANHEQQEKVSGERNQAAKRVLALLRQTMAHLVNERNGRADLQQLPF